MGLRFGGDMDDADNPADPFGLRGEIEEALRADIQDAINHLPPTSNQARAIISEYEKQRGKLPQHIRDELFNKLVHGQPVPPLPGNAGFNLSDWPAEPERESKFYDRYMKWLSK